MPLEALQRVDARGLSSPMPIVKTAWALRSTESGSLVEVLATDPGSVPDFDSGSRATGTELVEQSTHNGVYCFLIRRK